MNPEKILPTMDDWEVFPRVATATALRAMAEGWPACSAAKRSSTGRRKPGFAGPRRLPA